MLNRLWPALEKMAFDMFEPSLIVWLKEHTSEGMNWLLIHADDGVIWGKRNSDGSIALSSDISEFQPSFKSVGCQLRAETIQQIRIFGLSGELLVWRKEAQMHGRMLTDDATTPNSFWDEQHLLWGQPVKQAKGFTVLQEGQRGPVHAVPIDVPSKQRVALTVRHYINIDASGTASVSMSRLVQLGLYYDHKEKSNGTQTL